MDVYDKTFDLKALIEHWVSSPLPTERLAAQFVNGWLDSFAFSIRGYSDIQTLIEIILDLEDRDGGGRRSLPSLKPIDRINTDVWAVFCAAHAAWTKSFEENRVST